MAATGRPTIRYVFNQNQLAWCVAAASADADNNKAEKQARETENKNKDEEEYSGKNQELLPVY